jgi:hypothetical protein
MGDLLAFVLSKPLLPPGREVDTGRFSDAEFEKNGPQRFVNLY